MAVDFRVIELDQRNDGDEIQSILGEITGGRTVRFLFKIIDFFKLIPGIKKKVSVFPNFYIIS